jgi:hypothetical protein
MAELGPITVTISARLGDASLPIKPITFDVPLRTVTTTTLIETEATYDLIIDRGDLRDQMSKAVKSLADDIEAAFSEPGAVLLTCDVCGNEVASDTVSNLRHEKNGAHSLTPVTVTLTAADGVARVVDGVAYSADAIAADALEFDKDES